MIEPYYPDDAVALLREARYDPNARPGLELVSGSFLWNDESDTYIGFVAACRSKGCLAYWEPLAFRSSVILGQPDERCRRGWEELRRVCPDWPGFRSERYSESLRAELERQVAEEPADMIQPVHLNALRPITVLFSGDFHQLASFMLRGFDALTKNTNTTSRPTLYGVARAFASLFLDLDLKSIEDNLRQRGFDLGAIVQWDPDGQRGST